ncbi:MAG: hypothetical protein ABI621_14555 [Chloroflexota bacterium]
MPRILRTLLLLTLILSACSPGGLSPEAPPPALAADVPTEIITPGSPSELPTNEIIPISTPEVLPPPKLITTVSTPHIDQGPDGASTVVPPYPQGCGYQWAYKDLPELSSDFQESIQLLQSAAQANAFGFGEDCIHADGTSTFIPMETDFNITLQVGDLSDESELGDWTVKVMQVIENIPSDQIIGPRPGRVIIIFQSNAEQKSVSFYIDQYQALSAGLSHAEIYQALEIPQ